MKRVHAGHCEFPQKSIFRYDGRKSRTCYYGQVSDVADFPVSCYGDVADLSRGSRRNGIWPLHSTRKL